MITPGEPVEYLGSLRGGQCTVQPHDYPNSMQQWYIQGKSQEYPSIYGTSETLSQISDDVGFPSVCCECVLLPLVNKEATLAYGRAEYSQIRKDI